MTEKRTRRLRNRFIIIKKPIIGYDVSCVVMGCLWHSKAWDYHQNALAAGYEHARTHD